MSNRIAVCLCLIAISLTACGGGGARPKPAGPVVDTPPAEVKAVIVPFADFKFAEPEPVFVLKKNALPARAFVSVVHSYRATTVDKIAVTLVSASIDGDLLTIKLAIKNNGLATLYEPWNSAGGEIQSAIDEHGRAFPPQAVSPAIGKAMLAKTKLGVGEALTDFIAFRAPNANSQEVDYKLSGRNVGLSGQAFTFKMGREFFAKKEDERLAKLDEERQREDFKIPHAAWVARRVVALAKHGEDAAADAERQRKEFLVKHEAQQKEIAATKARAEEMRAEAAVAAAEAAEAAKPKVSRENYRKIQIGASFSEVRDILGGGLERSQTGNFQTMVWHEEGSYLIGTPSCTIIITFRNGSVFSRAID